MPTNTSQRGATRVATRRPGSGLPPEHRPVQAVQRQATASPEQDTAMAPRGERAMALQRGTGSGALAPRGAEYLVGTAEQKLTAERVVTDTPTITWDLVTAGQAKAHLAVETGTFTLTATGFTVNPTGIAAYRVIAQRLASLFLPQLFGTSNATTFTLTGIPAALQPATFTMLSHATAGQNNGADINDAFLRINAASGTWEVFLNAPSGGWGPANGKGLYAHCLTYPLD